MPRKKSAPVRKQVSSSLSSSADTGASSLNGPGNFVSFATAAAAADAAANLSPRHECHPMVTAPLLKSAAQETADAALDEYTLLAFWELPSWLQNNPHIKTGYRAKFTMRLTLLSLFRMHNETLNVWTHLLGFLLVLGIIISNTYGYWESSWLDKAIFYVFWFSALLCLAASTLYHWMHCYSARACYNLALVDYCSIAVLVVGSFYPTIYYGFAHGRFWQVLYLSAITVFGSVGIIGPFFSALPRTGVSSDSDTVVHRHRCVRYNSDRARALANSRVGHSAAHLRDVRQLRRWHADLRIAYPGALVAGKVRSAVLITSAVALLRGGRHLVSSYALCTIVRTLDGARVV